MSILLLVILANSQILYALPITGINEESENLQTQNPADFSIDEPISIVEGISKYVFSKINEPGQERTDDTLELNPSFKAYFSDENWMPSWLLSSKRDVLSKLHVVPYATSSTPWINWPFRKVNRNWLIASVINESKAGTDSSKIPTEKVDNKSPLTDEKSPSKTEGTAVPELHTKNIAISAPSPNKGQQTSPAHQPDLNPNHVAVPAPSPIKGQHVPPAHQPESTTHQLSNDVNSKGAIHHPEDSTTSASDTSGKKNSNLAQEKSPLKPVNAAPTSQSNESTPKIENTLTNDHPSSTASNLPNSQLKNETPTTVQEISKTEPTAGAMLSSEQALAHNTVQKQHTVYRHPMSPPSHHNAPMNDHQLVKRDEDGVLDHENEGFNKPELKYEDNEEN